ncbi:periplasmic binding protein-like II [Purpureocillium lavendulum]|uniref:Periplasmic binding protein-like II n=1 Tax=Purpureocillium lavendulum TaxID=1247861 RepID=A0AB34FHY9_9HYPO|nr:periplasmic binding protein-like II [Purpureocillium lavendulum]
MADEGSSLKVEAFEPTTGMKLLRYGGVIMRQPEVRLLWACDYLKWVRDLRKCANDAGLLGHFDGTAIRPSAPGAEQKVFDETQQAMINFVAWSLDDFIMDEEGNTRAELLQAFRLVLESGSGVTAPMLVGYIKQIVLCKSQLQSALFKVPNGDHGDLEDAITSLNYAWDNLKEFEAETPDWIYVAAGWTGKDPNTMAADQSSREVEFILSASGVRLFKFGVIAMRRPEVILGEVYDYLRWIRALRECSNDSGLLGHFEGTARRPAIPGPEQRNFDAKRAAMNRFVTLTVADHLLCPELTRPQDLDTMSTSNVVLLVRDRIQSDCPLENCLDSFFRTRYYGEDINATIHTLNYDWDNLKELYPELPDPFYIGAVFQCFTRSDQGGLLQDFLTSFHPRLPSASDIRDFLDERLAQK